MLDKYFRINPGHVQRRPKVRGKKRFLKTILRDAHQFALPTCEELGGPGWHTHVDWNGYGNLNWDFRKQYIEALCIMFKKFADNRHLYPDQFQLYLLVYAECPQADSVDFNVGPSNRDADFPEKFENARWDAVPELEQYFSDLLAPRKIKVGRLDGGRYSDAYLIYAPAIGIPIE